MFRLTTIIYGISASLLSSLAGSKDGATYVNHVLIQLKQPKQGLEQTFVLTEEELNDFTRAAIQSKKRLGIEKLEFNLQTGGFHSTALINMEEVDLCAGAQIFKPLLRGTHRLELTGNFVSNECKGVYQVEDARFNDLPCPRLVCQRCTLIPRETATSSHRCHRAFRSPLRHTGHPYPERQSHRH